jgi:hypothetical protein
MLRPYKTYRFTRRDPVLSKTLMVMDGIKASEISKLSGVSVSTLSNWRKKNKRPNFCTIAAVWLACGMTSVPLKGNGDD